jgi:FKBP-type peptidyl-prolyl cis-trans isomerase
MFFKHILIVSYMGCYTADIMKYVAGGVVVVALVIIIIIWLRGAPERTMPEPTTAPRIDVTSSPKDTAQPLEQNKVTTNNMKIETTKEGSGVEIKNGQTAVVDYVGKLTDGTIFDASARHGRSFEFPLGAGMVIKGWDQGVLGMKVGETRVLTIPPELGYGASGAGGVIPPNATLVFEVTLVGIK